MPEIKTKEFINAKEAFDTVSDLGDRMRRGLAKSTDRARTLTEDGQGSSTEYASDQFQNTAEDIGYEAGHIVVDTAKDTDKTIREATEKFIERRRSEPQKVHRKPPETRRITKAFKKSETTVKQTTQTASRTAQRTVKDSQRAVKASQEANRLSVRTAQETARAAERSARIAAETARKTAEAAKAAAKAAADAAKAAAKAVVAAGKAIAAAVEELATAIASGGWVVLVVIAVIIIIIVIISAVAGYLDTITLDTNPRVSVLSTLLTSQIKNIPVYRKLCRSLRSGIT